jgi:hypothetical protein
MILKYQISMLLQLYKFTTIPASTAFSASFMDRTYFPIQNAAPTTLLQSIPDGKSALSANAAHASTKKNNSSVHKVEYLTSNIVI